MAIRFTLRELLKERFISERKFAQGLGLNEVTFYSICNNNGKIKRVPVEFMDKVCAALDVQPGDWIKWESDEEDE